MGLNDRSEIYLGLAEGEEMWLTKSYGDLVYIRGTDLYFTNIAEACAFFRDAAEALGQKGSG